MAMDVALINEKQILWFQLTIFWAMYGSVYDQSGTINLYGPEYGQPGMESLKEN